MTDNFGSIILGAVSGQTLPAVWHLIPEGVKNRCGQGFDRLTGRLTRKWDRKDKKEDAGINDGIKREGNKSEAQKKVLELLAPDVAKKISADPELMERATIEMMGDAYRKQQNKDAVAEEAIKDIGEKYINSSSTNDKLDDDWLNIFSSYAEKASSERTRQLWGRILSGEVRHPGRFSLSTLRLLSEIDQSTAKNFVELAPIIDGTNIIVSTKYKNDRFHKFLSLQQSGIISGADTLLSISTKIDNDGNGHLLIGDIFIIIKSQQNIDVDIPAMCLTQTGKELLSIIDYNIDKTQKLDRISEAIEENNFVTSYKMFDIIKVEKSQINYRKDPIKYWVKQKL